MTHQAKTSLSEAQRSQLAQCVLLRSELCCEGRQAILISPLLSDSGPGSSCCEPLSDFLCSTSPSPSTWTSSMARSLVAS